jgi:invasion protein IalB
MTSTRMERARKATLTAIPLTVVVVVCFGAAIVQQPATSPARQKPATSEPPVAEAQPAPAATAPQSAAPPPWPEMPQITYSPWAKFCGKCQDATAKQVCFTGKEARTEAGQPVVAAVLIEPDGGPKKLFRITLPSPLQLQYGARVIIDHKHGQMLTIQAINLAGSAISLPLPLVDFTKGP